MGAWWQAATRRFLRDGVEICNCNGYRLLELDGQLYVFHWEAFKDRGQVLAVVDMYGTEEYEDLPITLRRAHTAWRAKQTGVL